MFRNIWGGARDERCCDVAARLNYSWLNELPKSGDPAYTKGMRDAMLDNLDFMALAPDLFTASGEYTAEEPRPPWPGAGVAQRCALLHWDPLTVVARCYRVICETGLAGKRLFFDTTGLLAEWQAERVGELCKMVLDGGGSLPVAAIWAPRRSMKYLTESAIVAMEMHFDQALEPQIEKAEWLAEYGHTGRLMLVANLSVNWRENRAVAINELLQVVGLVKDSGNQLVARFKSDEVPAHELARWFR